MGKGEIARYEQLLITSNFSFSHSVFKRLVSQGGQKVSLCGNGLRPGIVILFIFIQVTITNTGLKISQIFSAFRSDLYFIDLFVLTMYISQYINEPYPNRILRVNYGSRLVKTGGCLQIIMICSFQ